MSEVAHDAPQEFWRPPAAEPAALEPNVQSKMVEVCDRCETEFIAGSRFCHVCGASRSSHRESSAARHWPRRIRKWLRHLEFHNIQRWADILKQQLGIPTAALVSFIVGLGCVAGAFLVGLVFTVQTTLDWQAVQLWRIEWLLGASAAFLAGILLKKSAN
ncbi:MAG TPA: hypothetical protein VEI01_20465 [Terriglobales bacterium]|jgi:hypothetical protein|nr:hypothetical protein [Terriglobales bacterium]